ncbi:MAG: creatininase family protein [Deltaproteobacteria bacterium]|nr:MAG: creatininase family protein [Deltaproteobacteria bacterium]
MRLLLLALLPGCAPAPEAPPASPPASAPRVEVFLEAMTTVEVSAALAAGKTTVLIPTGGTEQNGPHMALGKHRYIVEAAAEAIAVELGDALVAPTLSYVPEGELDPPTGHMRFAGTLTVPPDVFGAVVEHAARSLRVHGFTDIVLLGDSGGNQAPLETVAARLNAEWAADPTRVHFAGDYYTNEGFVPWLKEQGATRIGTHAGIADTSVLLHVAPEHVRTDALAPGTGLDGNGVTGDPTRASAAYGAEGFDRKVRAAVTQIRALRDAP